MNILSRFFQQAKNLDRLVGGNRARDAQENHSSFFFFFLPFFFSSSISSSASGASSTFPSPATDTTEGISSVTGSATILFAMISSMVILCSTMSLSAFSTSTGIGYGVPLDFMARAQRSVMRMSWYLSDV